MIVLNVYLISFARDHQLDDWLSHYRLPSDARRVPMNNIIFGAIIQASRQAATLQHCIVLHAFRCLTGKFTS